MEEKMSKIRIPALLMAIGIVMVSSVAFAAFTAPKGGIVGSAHDLSNTGPALGSWSGGTETRICVFCHAPHNTYKLGDVGGLDYFPLWNHAVTTYATFTGYSNTDPNAPVVPANFAGAVLTNHQLNVGLDGQIIAQPGGVSRLCLSCHDGSVAVGAYGFLPSSSVGTGISKITSASRAFIGGLQNLANHHPIGFSYQEAISNGDTEIRPVGSPMRTSSLGLTIQDVLWGGKVECTSCHDVHNTQNDGARLVWVDDTQSNLCLSCHAKAP
jgi:predicted CXXCH cytochrome family protein